jgi:undecaprenyl diphosphate synthase
VTPAHADASEPATDAGAVPRHIAIIMDGNGRWAKKRLLPRVAGHRAGVEAVRKIARAAREMGIGTLTLYAFSSENWRRPEEEIGDLMGLLRHFIGQHLDELVADGIRLRIIGDLSAFTPDIRALVEDAIARTAANTGPQLVIALNYGAQDEILRAVRQLAEEGGEIDKARFERALYTHDLPPLDLLIRTSGEKRLSNFLLWQAAYAELLFVDTLWPDFGPDELKAAIGEFATRERRYGGL